MKGTALYLGFCVRCGQAVVMSNHRAVLYVAPLPERRCWSCKWVADTPAEQAARSTAHAVFYAQREAAGCTCKFSWPVRLNQECPMHGETALAKQELGEHYAAETDANR